MYLKKSFLFVLLFLLTFEVYAQTQKNKPKGIIFGTSVTYRNDTEEGPSNFIIYQDVTWNLNAAVFISGHLRLGLTSLRIFEKNEFADWENFFMLGSMLQYEYILPKTRSPFVLETGLFYGDFAPVTGDLIKRKGTWFADIGVSYEQYLTRHLYLELGVNYYPALGRIENKDNFVLYVVGINYFLGER